MRTAISVLVVLTGAAVLPVSSTAFAHGAALAATEPQPPPTFTLEKVGEQVWCLFGRGGNVAFMVTDAGVVVVDDQYGDVAPGIVEQIRSVADKPIRYLINTHYHADHTGGNKVFQPIATIVAHDTVRPRLLEYPRVVLSTFPDRISGLEAEIASIKDAADLYRAALEKDVGIMKYFLDSAQGFDPATEAPPALTFDSRLTLWLGDQPVEVFHPGPGHTDGDAVVWFRKAKVLHTGDLLFNGMVPYIDTAGGGSAAGYLKSLDRILATLPPDTRVIPGHGPVTDMKGLARARDFLKDLNVEVEKAVKKGLSRAEVARTVRLDSYPDVKPAFRTLANVALAFYDESRAHR
jgi:glyoxylase-like metal-dependent hydrolase (beta-lactamase superfamily II)